MKRIGLLVAAGMLVVAPSTFAQDAPTPIIFGMYLRCNQAQQSRADEIARNVYGPIIQKHVDAGHLTGWAWLAHVVGGPWRRLMVFNGTDMNTMIEMRRQIVQEFVNENADAASESWSICGSHDDYIWSGISNSPPDPSSAGNAALSTYYVCDNSREGRSNETSKRCWPRCSRNMKTWGTSLGGASGPIVRAAGFVVS